MEVKVTILGAFIYAALAAHVAASAAFVLKRRRAGAALFACGFGLAVAALACRWVQVSHVPLQNLFEVFLCLAMLVYPLSLFWTRFLEVRGQALDALIGAAVLFAAGFVFGAEPKRLPPALQTWLFGPHVASYLLAYLLLIKASVQACMQLTGGGRKEADASASGKASELATYRLVRLGFPLLTLGLVLGCWWAKVAWGDYWQWDPKELWSLATWLVFLTYLHFRHTFGARFARLNAALAVCGGAAILITLLWVNLAARIFPGLHVYGA